MRTGILVVAIATLTLLATVQQPRVKRLDGTTISSEEIDKAAMQAIAEDPRILILAPRMFLVWARKAAG